jgi:hypothetical protein
MYIHVTKTYSFSSEHSSWGCNEFTRREAFERSTNLKGHCFTIQCDAMVCKDNNTSRDALDVLVSDIGQHANNLLQNKVGVDVALGQPRDIHI